MILEYSYDKANRILDLFKESKIATLEIKKTGAEDDATYVMEYTVLTDYTEPKQVRIKEALSESLPERLKLTTILTTFVENQILDNVKDFGFKFNAVNARKCEVSYFATYKNQVVEENCLVKQLERCLERYDYIITKMGATDQQTELFKKEPGKGKKYSQLTLGEVGLELRQALEK